MDISKYFKITIACLALTACLEKETVVREVVVPVAPAPNEVPKAEGAGGMDGSGGNVSSSKPETVESYAKTFWLNIPNIASRIQLVYGQLDLTDAYNRDEKFLYDAVNADLLKVYKQTKLEIVDGPCFDKGLQQERDASYLSEGKVCLSKSRLTRFSSDQLRIELLPLLIHELSHGNKFNEHDAELLQKILLANAMFILGPKIHPYYPKNADEYRRNVHSELNNYYLRLYSQFLFQDQDPAMLQGLANTVFNSGNINYNLADLWIFTPHAADSFRSMSFGVFPQSGVNAKFLVTALENAKKLNTEIGSAESYLAFVSSRSYRSVIAKPELFVSKLSLILETAKVFLETGVTIPDTSIDSVKCFVAFDIKKNGDQFQSLPVSQFEAHGHFPEYAAQDGDFKIQFSKTLSDEDNQSVLSTSKIFGVSAWLSLEKSVELIGATNAGLSFNGGVLGILQKGSADTMEWHIRIKRGNGNVPIPEVEHKIRCEVGQ